MENRIDWPEKIFVTGIDTDCGKSYATGWLANLIREDGGSVITQKFVQTGNKEYSEDIERHRRIMGMEPTCWDLTHVTAPVIFSYPASPELAARIDNTEINMRLIDEATATLSKEFDHVLIEGAGGLMVPLKGDYLTIDYIREKELPAVLVTDGKLGSINHTLLSLYALKHHGIRVLAVIYNTYFDKDKIIAEDTRNYIRHWLESHFSDTIMLTMPRID